MATLKIWLDDRLDAELTDFLARTGRGRSEFARDALKRQLVLARLGEIRRHVAPLAKAHGWSTDDDVFRELS